MSLNIIRDILLHHHTTHARISVFHSDLPAMQTSLRLHAIPSDGLSLTQCRHVLLHHITTGACEHHVLATLRPDRSACRALSRDFDCAANMSKVVLDIILNADHKQMTTESLSHVGAALNTSIPGTRNL